MGHRKLCLMMCFCVCVCVAKTKPRNNVLEQGLRVIIGQKSEGVAGG